MSFCRRSTFIVKGMTLYHIGYVEVGNILVLHGIIGVKGCDHVV